MENPLRAMQEAAGGVFGNYGPDGSASGGGGQSGAAIVLTFGRYEAEYAAIRKGVAIMDQPQLGVVELSGIDRTAFLHRLVSNDIRKLAPSQGCRAFLLRKTGQIVADFIVLQGAEHTLLVLDVLDAPTLVAELQRYLFDENVQIADVSSQHVHIAVHGPQSGHLLSDLAGQTVADLEPLQHREARLDGGRCTLYRRDQTGVLGLHLIVGRDAAAAVYDQLTKAVGGIDPEVDAGTKRPHIGRGIGWLAFNTARIEAGTPLFHVDFGPDSLPGETGLVDETISFTKGCYIGQEIVARMKNRGHPRRVLVGVRCPDDRLPIAGTEVFAAGDVPASSSGAGTSAGHTTATGQAIGGITSSTLSPLLGNVAIALASVKWGQHETGKQVMVPAEGALVPATIQSLNFM